MIISRNRLIRRLVGHPDGRKRSALPRKWTDGGGLLDVRDVSKRFGGVEAVRQVSLTVQRGQIVGLIGPNGAGKSTLVNLVSRHESPDSGEIYLDGRAIHGLPAYKVARAGLSRTYQRTRLFWEDTVAENIRTAMVWLGRNTVPHGLSYPGVSGSIDQRLEALLEFFGLSEHRERLPHDLSHVLQRRVEVAQALALAPRLLVLDEPFAGLTRDESFELIELLDKCRRGGLTMLVIDHNMHVIMRICEHIYVMHHGSVIAAGTPAEIHANDRVISVYLAGEL
jgi:ABC-type branched-subunit amino acid transport system ATPase component